MWLLTCPFEVWSLLMSSPIQQTPCPSCSPIPYSLPLLHSSKPIRAYHHWEVPLAAKGFLEPLFWVLLPLCPVLRSGLLSSCTHTWWELAFSHLLLQMEPTQSPLSKTICMWMPAGISVCREQGAVGSLLCEFLHPYIFSKVKSSVSILPVFCLSWYRGLNPGHCTCWGDSIPLSYIPSPTL